jgi:hypothetical protein
MKAVLKPHIGEMVNGDPCFAKASQGRKKARPTPQRLRSAEQTSPFNYCRFNRASVWSLDADVFQRAGGQRDDGGVYAGQAHA